jgi:aquaporin Z
LFVGGWALAQLWLFWVAPLAGAVIGGFAYKWLGGEVKAPVVGRPAASAE